MPIHGVPRLPPGTIERPRITRIVENEAALTVLCAPAGYGKTVALASWAARTDQEGVWVCLREGNADPAAFVSHVAHTLEDWGYLGADNPLRTADESLMVADPWTLLERGIRQIGAPCTVIVDNGDCVNPETVCGLVSLLSTCTQLTVKAAVRSATGLAEPSIGTSVPAVFVDSHELEFTLHETASVIGEPVDSERVLRASQMTTVPALIRMVPVGVVPGVQSEMDLFRTQVRSLLAVRLPGMGERFAAFMRTVSFAELLDAELATALTREAESVTLLDRAESEGFGSWIVGPNREHLFELSTVFRAAAEEQARRTLPVAEILRIEKTIALWYRDRGRPLPAVRLALRCGELELADDIVREYWSEVLLSGEEFSGLFVDVPMTTFRELPCIATVLALHLANRGSHRRADDFLVLAIRAAGAKRAVSAPDERALLYTIETVAHRKRGRIGTSVRSAQRALETLQSLGPIERDRIVGNAPTLYNQIGLSFGRAEHLARAVECYAAAVSVAGNRGRHLFATFEGLALQAWTRAAAGDMPEAADALHEIERRRWPDGWMEGTPGVAVVLARLYGALDAGDIGTALTLRGALHGDHGRLELEIPIVRADAMTLVLAGRPEQALVALESALDRPHQSRAGLADSSERLAPVRAILQLASGNAPAALHALRTVGDTEETRVGRARVALSIGDARSALNLLSASGGAAVEDGSSRVRAERIALRTGALALIDHDSSAEQGSDATRASLRQLIAFLEHRGQFLALALVPASALEVLLRVAGSRHEDEGMAGTLRRALDAGVIPGRARIVAPLTRRERIIASELRRLRSIDEIASVVRVSRNTVKSQLRSLYRKLNASNRDEALQMISLLDD